MLVQLLLFLFFPSFLVFAVLPRSLRATCRILLCPPWFCSSSVLTKCVSGYVSVCTMLRETGLNYLNFSQLARIDTDGTLQHSAWAVLVWLRHIYFVSVLLLACFIVSLCRNICCLAWQVLSWVLWSFLRHPVPLGSVVWMCICIVTRVAQVPALIDWNKSGSTEFVLEPFMCFLYFYSWGLEDATDPVLDRSCFQHSPC